MSCLNLLERLKAEDVAADIAIHNYPPPGDHPVRRVAHALYYRPRQRHANELREAVAAGGKPKD